MNVNLSKYKKALAHMKKALDFMEKALTTSPAKGAKRAKKAKARVTKKK